MPTKLLLALLSLSLLAAACGSETAEAGADLATIEQVDARSDTTDQAMESVESDAEPPAALATGDDVTFASVIGATAAHQTGRFEGRYELVGPDASGVSQSVDMLISGSYDDRIKAVEMTVDLSAFVSAAAEADDSVPPGMEALFGEPLRTISIGDETWMKWPLVSALSGSEDAWLVVAPEDLASSTGGLGFGTGVSDPAKILADLAGADALVTEVDTETIRGVETSHWQVLVNLKQLAGALDPAGRAEMEAQLGDLDQIELPIDLWVGVDDGLIYRYVITVNAPTVSEEPSLTAISYDLFDHGQDVAIAPPPADEIVDPDDQ